MAPITVKDEKAHGAQRLPEKIRLFEGLKHGTNTKDNALGPNQHHIEKTRSLVEF